MRSAHLNNPFPLSTKVETITLPAYGVGESYTFHVVEGWRWVLESLVAKHCQYGPTYSRPIMSNLRDMSLFCQRDEIEVAETYLKRAQAIAWEVDNA